MITRVLILLVLASCEDHTSAGTYVGLEIRRTYSEPQSVKFEEELGKKITVTKESADVLRVDFARCWVKVHRPKQKVDSTWYVIDGSSCPSVAGDVKLGTGGLLVLDEKRVSLDVNGLTSDGTRVTIAFTGNKQ